MNEEILIIEYPKNMTGFPKKGKIIHRLSLPEFHRKIGTILLDIISKMQTNVYDIETDGDIVQIGTFDSEIESRRIGLKSRETIKILSKTLKKIIQ